EFARLNPNHPAHEATVFLRRETTRVCFYVTVRFAATPNRQVIGSIKDHHEHACEGPAIERWRMGRRTAPVIADIVQKLRTVDCVTVRHNDQAVIVEVKRNHKLAS
ncbi:hypothetical protein LINPERHAP1_LOCUS36404, partial [Linum perenne]